MKRYLILLAAVVMQMCLGATYSWSVYVDPLRGMTGLSQAMLQAPFSMFYFAFPVMIIAASSWLLPKLGPRCCSVCGGFFFGCGWLLAWAGQVHFAFTVVGIGLLAGVGAGLAYLVPISICIQWFPHHRGLVTGIAVAGFGGGAALVSRLGGWLVHHWGASPYQTFAALGGLFLVLIPSAGMLMVRPGATGQHSISPVVIAPLLRQRCFRLLYLGIFAGLAAGFVVNANLKQFYDGTAVSAGVQAVGLFAIANALGRIVWGAVADRLGPSLAIQSNLLLQALVLLLVLGGFDATTKFFVFAFLVGFNYGGVLVVYVAAVAQHWGRERVAQIYGLLFSANIPAAMAPVLAGFSYDLNRSFGFPAVVLAILLVTTAVWLRWNLPTLGIDNTPDVSSNTPSPDR